MLTNFSTGHANMQCEAFKAAYTHGLIGIFGGATMPASPDLAETGVLLALITLNAQTVTPGILANGLTFGAVAAGVLPKSSDVWRGLGLVAAGAGTLATYWRMYTNAYTLGGSLIAPRLDGDLSDNAPLATGSLKLDSTTIVSGEYVYVHTFTYTPPTV